MTLMRLRHGCHSELAESRAWSPSGGASRTVRANGSWSRCDACDPSIASWEVTWSNGSGLPAALVLGLYDPCGILHHIGNTSVLPAAQQEHAASMLRSHRDKPSFIDGLMPGYGRWPGQRNIVWRHVAPEVVCEV